MRILIVANNKSGNFSPFVVEQVDSLRQIDVDIDCFGVTGKGFLGYLKCLPSLNRKIKEYQPDLIHAHYGLSGLLANLQRKTPVITTFHGSDIHTGGWLFKLSKLCMRLSVYNIFVADYLFKLSNYKKNNYLIQACGLDLETIEPTCFQKAREYFGWNLKDKYVLFSGNFSNAIKNSTLAKAAINEIGNKVNLVELKGYTRKEVSLLMSACDCLLLTSLREASPTVIKEAMACNRPLVTTDVGDVRWVIGDTEGCYITSYDVDDCADSIEKAIAFSIEKNQTNGRKRIIKIGLDSKTVAQKIFNVYKEILRK